MLSLARSLHSLEAQGSQRKAKVPGKPLRFEIWDLRSEIRFSNRDEGDEREERDNGNCGGRL